LFNNCRAVQAQSFVNLQAGSHAQDQVGPFAARAEDETKPEEGRREAAAKGEGKMTETGRFAARPWTPADDEVLRSLALNGVDARGIGNRLNRTADAVRSRAKRLNILIRKHRGSAEDKEAMGKRSTWTSKDDDQLRALAASGENSPAIAARLNRTAAGVRKRAIALGIKLAGSKRELGLKAKK